MPIEVTFTLRPGTPYRRELLDRLFQLVAQTPEIPNSGLSAKLTEKPASTKVEVLIKGVSLEDSESGVMFTNIIRARLGEDESPFRLTAVTRFAPEPHEITFDHVRLRPKTTRNHERTKNIPNLEVPPEFICPLGGVIMDNPVYDVRSPSYICDESFLLYWLNKTDQREMPHTRLPSKPSLIKHKSVLKSGIVRFVSLAEEAHENKKLQSLLDELKCNAPVDLNKALRRAACYKEASDVEFLLRCGADVNAKDTAEEKGFTALHLALRKRRLDIAVNLIWCGSSVSIKSATGVTQADLIRGLPPLDRQKFTCVSHQLKLGLELPAASSPAGLQSVRLPTAARSPAP